MLMPSPSVNDGHLKVNVIESTVQSLKSKLPHFLPQVTDFAALFSFGSADPCFSFLRRVPSTMAANSIKPKLRLDRNFFPQSSGLLMSKV
jgi:hypothetical protein